MNEAGARAAGNGQSSPGLQMWMGFECSIVRIGDHYRNQIEETGHLIRKTDLAEAFDLGVLKIRFPVLWEMIQPDGQERDWEWTDTWLEEVRGRGIEPIAGLLHHGSGPPSTNLLDPEFPERFARHAAAVAERYPWIETYTPINEPNTTARFSCLYGHWYPHVRSTPAFLRALVNQIRATALAMRAIRKIVPEAKLLQTEDFGIVASTPRLRYQADYENLRRRLGFDLLFGRVDRDHPLYAHLRENGITEAELTAFLDEPCPPDTIGVNHYLTSHRYLDENIGGYPPECRGGNGRHRYSDVAAVRVACGIAPGPEACLMEAWERYRVPLAITEAHNGSTREEQVRWLMDVWRAAESARRQGADVRAVTAWAAAGCYDWNTLLLMRHNTYECGLIDARERPPRRTLSGHAVRSLARTGSFDHPVLDDSGWWQRPDRLHERPAPRRGPGGARRLMIIGKTGTLGRAFVRICEERHLAHVLVGRDQIDIADGGSVAAGLEEFKPWAVINAAGFVRVSEAAARREDCLRENVIGAEVLASACGRLGIPLVTFSSDLVFDGRLSRQMLESDPVSPVCVYGESKALAESRVLTAYPEALVVRTSAFFGPWDRYNLLHIAMLELAAGRAFAASDDVRVSPTFVPDLAGATLDLLLDRASGLWHVANAGSASWFEFLRAGAKALRLDERLLQRSPSTPRCTALASERGLCMPDLDNAIGRFAKLWEGPR
jgi:dTDP-4-dehydrorhamnose reductase